MRAPAIALVALVAIAARGLHAALTSRRSECYALPGGALRCISETPTWAAPVGIASGIMLLGLAGMIGFRLFRRRG